MANTRFLLYGANRAIKIPATATFPKIVNGDPAYSGAPALEQDPAFPMSNVLSGDRYRVWKTASPPTQGTDVVIELDLGSSKTVSAWGVCGFRLGSGALFPGSVQFAYLNSPTYNAAGFTTVAATLGLTNARDTGAEVSIVARYLRWTFINAGLSNGFSVGKLLASLVSKNLGFVYAPGSAELVSPTHARVRSMSGALFTTQYGDRQRALSYRFTSVADDTKQFLVALADQSKPFLVMTFDDRLLECALREGVETEHVWNAPNLWNIALRLEVLP